MDTSGGVMAEGSLRQEIEDALAGRLPPEIRQRMEAMVADLRRDDVVPGLPVGAPAPDFTLPDAHGGRFTLHDRLRTGPVVLCFYRGDWCPICNVQLRALQRILPAMAELGASLVAVSPQAPERSLLLSEELELDFDVLSDLEQEAAAAYRIRFPLGHQLREIYEQFIPLPDQNADRSWNLPVPATFVIDTDATIRARHVDADYQQRMEPDAVLAALRELGR